MNRRVCVRIGSILIGPTLGWAAANTIGGSGTTAWGQQAAPPVSPGRAIPNNVKTSGNLAANDLAAIKQFVATQVKLLGSGVPASANPARKAIAAEYPRPSQNFSISSAYREAFAKEWADQCKPLMAPTSPLATRVSVGVVTADLAGNNAANALVPVVRGLLVDPNPGVRLWGLKAAKPLVVMVVVRLNGRGTDPLFRDVVNAVRNYPDPVFGGWLASDAYDALVVQAIPNTPPASLPPLIKVLFDPVMDLKDWRTLQYAKGVVGNPLAERDVPTFLSSAANVAQMTPAQQARAVQDLLDLLDAIGQRGPLLQPTDPTLRQMAVTFKNCAQALNVFYGRQAQGQVPIKYPRGISPTGKELADDGATAYRQMKVAFPKLVQPPTLPPVAPPTPAQPARPVAPPPNPGVPSLPAGQNP